MSQDPQNFSARAEIVNRTHRVVREQAMIMQQDRSTRRSFLVPILICSVLMALVCYAIWRILDGYDVTPSGIPDASDQMLIFLMWSLPVSAGALAFAWLRRSRNRHQSEVSR